MLHSWLWSQRRSGEMADTAVLEAAAPRGVKVQILSSAYGLVVKWQTHTLEVGTRIK